jgi:hypothetical protein
VQLGPEAQHLAGTLAAALAQLGDALGGDVHEP